MLYLGKNITAAADPLQPITVEELCTQIKTPQTPLARQVDHLRIVYATDAKRYAVSKRTLPYFVCGCFNPAVRKTENFGYIQYFVVDIDHLNEKNMNVSEIRGRIQQDARVRLCFLSPSNDGLKLLFHLKEKCHDAGLFSVFYRNFVRAFSAQHGLEQVIDTRTSDVTRACFLSHDENIYFNFLADDVDMNLFLDKDNPDELFCRHRQIMQEQRKETQTSETKQEPDAEAIAKIKQILGMRKEKAPVRPVYVPKTLNLIIADIEKFLRDAGLSVDATTDIQYGKKISVSLNKKQAECNIFYGKKGFSVVKSPRRGTDLELNDLMKQLIDAFLNL